MRKINEIIIHHSATKDGKTLSWDNIYNYHTQHNKWRDIGYHFGIELVEDSYQILIGRTPDQQGAHCRGNNSNSIGICCVGNYNLIQPSRFMLIKLDIILRWLLIQYNLKISDIKGHRDFYGTDCPGKLFDLILVKKRLYEKK